MLLPGRGVARENRKQGVWWALVADTHINRSPGVSERGGQMDERLRLVVRDILSSEEPLKGVIVNGDLAHRDGHPEAYTRVLGQVYPWRQAGLEVQWLLGNHDNREHFLQAAYGSRIPDLPVEGYYTRVIERGGVRWLLLDSLIRPNHTPGALGPAQLAWVRKKLDEDRRTPAILVLHHNFDESGGQLEEGRELFDLVRTSRQVKAVFQGHKYLLALWPELPATVSSRTTCRRVSKGGSECAAARKVAPALPCRKSAARKTPARA